MVKAGREAAPTITIDSFAMTVDLIKLDIEGMELRALEGGRQTIAHHQPFMYLEVHKSDGSAIAEFLTSHGYRGFVCVGELLAVPRARPITVEGLKQVF